MLMKGIGVFGLSNSTSKYVTLWSLPVMPCDTIAVLYPCSPVSKIGLLCSYIASISLLLPNLWTYTASLGASNGINSIIK